MYILFSFSLLALYILNLKKAEKWNPAYLLIVVWLFISSLNLVTKSYSISIFTQIIISSSLIAFVLPYFLINISGNISNNIKFAPVAYKELIKIEYILIASMICYAPVYYKALLDLLNNSSIADIALRDAMTNANSESSLSILISIGINIPILFSMYYSTVLAKIERANSLIIYSMSFLYCMSSLSKGYLLLFLIPNLCILYFRKKISLRLVKSFFVITILILVFMFLVRDSSVDFFILLKMYIEAPTAAFDLMVKGGHRLNMPQSPYLIPIYEILELEIKQDMDSLWAPLDVPTNVFTSFGIVYNDLGWLGCICFFFIYGVISRIFYIKAKYLTNSTSIDYIILGWMYYGAIISFFSDGFLGALPVYYKYILIAYLLMNLPKVLVYLKSSLVYSVSK